MCIKYEKMKKNILIIFNLVLVLILIGCSSIDKPVNNYTSDNNQLIASDNIPEHNGDVYIELNKNILELQDNDKNCLDTFDEYSELDKLGRCGVVYANTC